MPTNLNLRNFTIRHLDALIAAMAGFIMVHLYTKYSGAGISPDSIMYMSTARNLNDHLGYTYFGGKPIVAFPVFYPTFLAIAQFITRTDPLILAPYINGLLLATLVFLSGLIMERFTSKWYKWFILLAIVLSPSLLEIYSFLWSETLFMVWMLIFIIACHHYGQVHTTKALVTLAIVTALALITRYAGITLVGTGGLLLICDRELALRKKIKHIVLFGIISISLLIANLVRNAMVTHTGTGPRYKSLTSLSENMHYFGTVMCDWFTLSEKQYGLAFTITLLLILAFITAFLLNTFRNKSMYNSYENIIIAFFIVYALFMIISATISRYERINNRLLSALFIPFLLGCTYWIPIALKKAAPKFRLPLAVVALLVGVVFITGERSKDMQRYDDESEYGVPGYADDSWNKSALIYTLRTRPHIFEPAYPIYNNACEGFYFFTGRGSQYIPKTTVPADIKKFYALKHFYLVYFDQLPDTALLSLKDIQQHKKLTTIFHSADGGMYECNEP
jgi:hypothetical protein